MRTRPAARRKFRTGGGVSAPLGPSLRFGGYRVQIESKPDLHDSYREFFASPFGVEVGRERRPDGRHLRLPAETVLDVVGARAARIDGLQLLLFNRTLRQLPATMVPPVATAR
jgi:hypothetical protein